MVKETNHFVARFLTLNTIVCRSSESDNGDRRVLLFKESQKLVIGTEIVPPLTQTMRFIDHKSCQLIPSQKYLKSILKFSTTHDHFGGDVK